MERPPLKFTRHARRRADARRIPEAAIEAALDWGRPFRSYDDEGYRLDRRAVRTAAAQGVRLDRWEGVTVIVLATGEVRTVWRNRRPRRIWR